MPITAIVRSIPSVIIIIIIVIVIKAHKAFDLIIAHRRGFVKFAL
jgi:hypothetical protein